MSKKRQQTFNILKRRNFNIKRKRESIVAIFFVSLLLFCSCSQNTLSNNTGVEKYYVSDIEAIERAKDRFEQELQYSSNNGNSTVYKPTYGKCEAEEYGEDSWLVTVRGSYKVYKEQYGSKKIYDETFNKVYIIKKYEIR